MSLAGLFTQDLIDFTGSPISIEEDRDVTPSSTVYIGIFKYLKRTKEKLYLNQGGSIREYNQHQHREGYKEGIFLFLATQQIRIYRKKRPYLH